MIPRVAIISKPDHAKAMVQMLGAAGYSKLDMLGGSPTSIPKGIDVTIIRTDSCSHGASDVALFEKRAGRAVIFADGASVALQRLQERHPITVDQKPETKEATPLNQPTLSYAARLKELDGRGLVNECLDVLGWFSMRLHRADKTPAKLASEIHKAKLFVKIGFTTADIETLIKGMRERFDRRFYEASREVCGSPEKPSPGLNRTLVYFESARALWFRAPVFFRVGTFAISESRCAELALVLDCKVKAGGTMSPPPPSVKTVPEVPSAGAVLRAALPQPSLDLGLPKEKTPPSTVTAPAPTPVKVAPPAPPVPPVKVVPSVVKVEPTIVFTPKVEPVEPKAEPKPRIETFTPKRVTTFEEDMKTLDTMTRELMLKHNVKSWFVEEGKKVRYRRIVEIEGEME